MKSRKLCKFGVVASLALTTLVLTPSKVGATTLISEIPFSGYVTSENVTLKCAKDKGVSVLKVNNEAVTDTRTFAEDGEYSVEALNEAGEQMDVVEFVIDKTAPSVTGVSEGARYKSDVTIEVDDLTNVVATLDGKKVNTDSGVSCDTDGKHVFTAKDEVGNTTTVSFSIDTTKPSIKGFKSGKFYKKNITVKYSDKGVGVKKATLNGKAFRSGKKVSKTGRYTVKVWDKAGNCTTKKFVVDKVKPKIKKVDSYGNFFHISISENMYKYTCYVNGEKEFIHSDNKIMLQKGRKNTVVVKDKAGNKTKKIFKL